MENELKPPAVNYDVIVKGAGYTGLSTALAYAQGGKRVLVLEKNNKPGGRHSRFRRGNFDFCTTAESPEFILTLEKNIRDLGGEIWYKSFITRVKHCSSYYEVHLASGKVITCLLSIDTGNTERHGFTVWLGLDTSLPSTGAQGNSSMILSLTDQRMADRFDHIAEEDYFRVKDETARQIITEYEEKNKIDLRSHIMEMEATSPITWYRFTADSGKRGYSSQIADALHPTVQFSKILKVIDRGHAKSFVIGPDPARGTESLAYFRAGQYISILDQIGNARACKPYSLCCSPKNALGTHDTTYTVMIENNPNGFFSSHALKTWEIGTKLILSGPLGYFYYQPVRDARHIVALAGSSGITPFYSMAAAIADGIEDFDMTILYGSRTTDTILLRDELDSIVRNSHNRIRVVHILSDENREGFEAGFITPELIRKYVNTEDYSIFICGPKAMYEYLHQALPQLGIPERRIRFELPGEFGDPTDDPMYSRDQIGKTFQISIKERDTETTISCRSGQTLMQAIEQAGIVIKAACRSGQCGWCRSLLLSGKVFIPESREYRHQADRKFGWIHPCVTYPLSDIKLEISNN